MMKKGRINCSASGVKFPLHFFIQEILEEVGVNDCNCWRALIVLSLGGRWVKDGELVSYFFR